MRLSGYACGNYKYNCEQTSTQKNKTKNKTKKKQHNNNRNNNNNNKKQNNNNNNKKATYPPPPHATFKQRRIKRWEFVVYGFEFSSGFTDFMKVKAYTCRTKKTLAKKLRFYS